MLTTIYGFLAMALIFGATLAHPTNITEADGFWARFYDDDSCKINGGKSVSLANPGCLNEAGRGSFKIHGGDRHNRYFYYLISSPNNDCPCQSHCMLLPGSPFMFEYIKLQGRERGSSYRFFQGNWISQCPNNQCWCWTLCKWMLSEMFKPEAAQVLKCSRGCCELRYLKRYYRCIFFGK